MRAIADHVDRVLSGQRTPPSSVEGMSSSQWVLMDFGDVVAHIFRSDIRDHYALEKLWGDAKYVRLPAQKSSAQEPGIRPAKKIRSIRTRKQA